MTHAMHRPAARARGAAHRSSHLPLGGQLRSNQRLQRLPSPFRLAGGQRRVEVVRCSVALQQLAEAGGAAAAGGGARAAGRQRVAGCQGEVQRVLRVAQHAQQAAHDRRQHRLSLRLLRLVRRRLLVSAGGGVQQQLLQGRHQGAGRRRHRVLLLAAAAALRGSRLAGQQVLT